MTEIEHDLEQNGRCLFFTVGDSMEPLLHNRRSTVVVEKVKKPIECFDVVLFHRPGGAYVLHRVMKVRKKVYLICGDNRTFYERVPKNLVIGVMSGYFPDETETYVSCDSEAYRSYVKVWYPNHLRRRRKDFLKRCVGKIKRIMGS